MWMWLGKFLIFNASLFEMTKAGKYRFSKTHEVPKQEKLL